MIAAVLECRSQGRGSVTRWHGMGCLLAGTLEGRCGGVILRATAVRGPQEKVARVEKVWKEIHGAHRRVISMVSIGAK